MNQKQLNKRVIKQKERGWGGARGRGMFKCIKQTYLNTNNNPRPQLEPQITSLERCKIT